MMMENNVQTNCHVGKQQLDTKKLPEYPETTRLFNYSFAHSSGNADHKPDLTILYLYTSSPIDEVELFLLTIIETSTRKLCRRSS